MTQTPATHPYLADLDAEARGWRTLVDLVRSLTPEECVVPGYYVDPSWSVRDVMGHVGTWLAEAGVQFERIAAGTYGGHDVDIDALNASFLEAMSALREPSEEAAWWIRKSAVDHYDEHLDRLKEWVDELTSLRTP